MQYRFITRTAEIVNHIIKILRQAYQSGKPHEIIIREYDAKSREQEEKYHAMIGDISGSCCLCTPLPPDSRIK